MMNPLINLMKRPILRYNPLIRYMRGMVTLSDRHKLIQDSITFSSRFQNPIHYLEFGVYEGESLMMAYYSAKSRGVDIKLFGFDSFKGLPKPNGIDKNDQELWEGKFNCSLEDVHKNLMKNKIDSTKTLLVPGYYNHSLTPGLKKVIQYASIIFVDCDYYESTKQVLDFIMDLIIDGTVILFDDWFCYKGRNDEGEQKAFNEWKNENPQYLISNFKSFDSFIIHPIEQSKKKKNDL